MPSLSPATLAPQEINKPVEIIEGSYSKFDLDKVIGIGAFSLEKILSQEPEFLVGTPEQLAVRLNAKG